MALERNVKKKPARTHDRRNIWLLVLTTVLVVASVALFVPPQEKINQGLDIQGGLSVVLTAKSDDGGAVTADDMEKSRAIIESRVNALGASEATVQVQGSDQILVQIPGLSDTEEALATIGRTGSLTLARLDSFTDQEVVKQIQSGQYANEATFTDDYGNTFPTGETQHLTVEPGTYTPLVTGENITNVTIDRASETGTDYAVNVTLDAEGAAAFAEATAELAPTKGEIVIILDDEVQSAPRVQSEIPNGQVQITGNYTQEEAKNLQTILESGSLPVSFEYAQSQVVGPTLGQDALASGVLVALIGLAVVMLYLLVFYHGLGLITAAAMLVFAVLYLGILAALSAFGLFSLSLAGVAGIVLTIGMAADSSILTLERFREEIRMGRSVRAASITGVRHAILTSIDADLVTLVSALSLFFLASASVKGFGLTLALGILCDIVMMLLFKAPLIRLLAPKAIARHPGFWGTRDSVEAARAGEAAAKAAEADGAAKADGAQAAGTAEAAGAA
uniref:protein translocase subunit SecD n=1 Tax=Adlercreutzia sp. ZJ473 TaxID=2722822 RepID=UPI001551FED6